MNEWTFWRYMQFTAGCMLAFVVIGHLVLWPFGVPNNQTTDLILAGCGIVTGLVADYVIWKGNRNASTP